MLILMLDLMLILILDLIHADTDAGLMLILNLILMHLLSKESSLCMTKCLVKVII
jgi:hypothetical protein